LPSFEFPEAAVKGMHAPQFLVFNAGLLTVVVRDLNPSQFGTKTAQLLFLQIYSFIFACCLYPPAYLMNAGVTFYQMLSFTVILFAFCLLWAAILVLIAGLIFKEILGMDLIRKFNSIQSGREFALGCLAVGIWNAIVFLSIFRATYVSYKEFYDFQNWEIVLAGFGALLLSAIISPIIFIPFFFAWLKLRQVLEVIF